MDEQKPTLDAPVIGVPAGWEGSEAEAIGLAVAGAVGAIEKERAQLLEMLAEMVEKWPETSWAHDAMLKDRAAALLAELNGAPDPTT